LRTRGLAVERQIPLPIVYDGTTLDAGYRVDLMVEHAIIVEVKAVEALTPVHHAQLLTYLKLSKCRIGFLMNFHVALFNQGLKCMVL
jgi:GxxExxY protein